MADSGKLYLVATPIGNLGDMSARAVEVLENADLIAAEDTRNTLRLLNHFGIRTPLTSYHEYNRIEKAQELCGRMLEGMSVALVTDAGMPAISDPGEDLVRMSHDAGIEVTIVPGPCAAVSALALSGLPTRRFCFEGFLPTDKKELAQVLEELKDETRTMILYEAPHRLSKTLGLLAETLGADRKLSVVREITKLHEEVLRLTLGGAAEKYEKDAPKGEFVLIIEGRSRKELEAAERSIWQDISVKDHVAMYEEKGMDRKEAMKMAAKDRRTGKREIYRAMLEEENEGTED